MGLTRWVLEKGTKTHPYRFGINDYLKEDALTMYSQFSEAKDWCGEEFGHLDAFRWQTWGVDFLFRDHTDATSFKLRWG